MAEVLLSNEDLTVFGGPEGISLDLDIGPKGDRGSIIVGSNGNPQDANVNAEIMTQPSGIQALDIAIDFNEYSPTYKTLFQKVATATGTQWTPMLSLKTNFYSSVKDLFATNGVITIPPINITEIANNINLTSSDFSIQYSVSSKDGGPISTSLVVNSVVDNPIRALPLQIKGVEYIEGAWQPMTGPKRVHLFITVV